MRFNNIDAEGQEGIEVGIKAIITDQGDRRGGGADAPNVMVTVKAGRRWARDDASFPYRLNSGQVCRSFDTLDPASIGFSPDGRHSFIIAQIR